MSKPKAEATTAPSPSPSPSTPVVEPAQEPVKTSLEARIPQLPDADEFAEALKGFAGRYLRHHNLKMDWPRLDASFRLALRKIRFGWRDFINDGD